MTRQEQALKGGLDALMSVAARGVEFSPTGTAPWASVEALDDSTLTETMQLAGVEGPVRVITIRRGDYDARRGDSVKIDNEVWTVLRVIHVSPYRTRVHLGRQTAL